jgi:hypothetical protein
VIASQTVLPRPMMLNPTIKASAIG